MRAVLGLVLVASTASMVSADVCKPAGAVFVEVDQYPTIKAKRATKVTKLFENGAWTLLVVSGTGKETTRTGCLEQERFTRLRDQLKAATWKLVHRSVTCHAASPRFTLYRLAGTPVYGERPCGADVVGRADQDALDALALAVPIPNLGPDDGKPCLDNPLAAGCS